MDGKRTFQKIRLENFLSFGNEGMEIELQPLNVLIGPNASGKSNFFESFRFLKGVAEGNWVKVIREGGGINEYLWKGQPGIPIGKVETTVTSSQPSSSLTHSIGITAQGQLSRIVEERIAMVSAQQANADDSNSVYSYPDPNGRGLLWSMNTSHEQEIKLSQDVTIDADRSIIGWYRDPARYPELARLEEVFSNIQFGGEWSFSRLSPIRMPQKADLPTHVLWEDASNLGLIINNYRGNIKQRVTKHLQDVYGSLDEIFTHVQGNTVQIWIQEAGLHAPISTTRLSEGTLRYLCLLTLLNQPDPPQLLCLEEPEVGLHPDVIHTIADLLVEASQRVQIIVTTHSETLVSRLSEVSEAVIVCEREQSGTQLRRLQPAKLQEWLEDYSLGDLWRKGLLGGTRW